MGKRARLRHERARLRKATESATVIDEAASFHSFRGIDLSFAPERLASQPPADPALLLAQAAGIVAQQDEQDRRRRVMRSGAPLRRSTSVHPRHGMTAALALGRFIAYQQSPPAVVEPDPWQAFCVMWDYIARVHRERVESAYALACLATPRYFVTP